MRLLDIPPSGKAPAVVDMPSILTRESLDILMQDLKAAEENLHVGSIVLVFPEFADGIPPLDWQRLFPELDGVSPEGREREYVIDWNRRIEFLRNIYVPVVAAIDGQCSGWALELALAADILVCGEKAEFAVTECPNAMSYLAVGCGIQRTKRLLMFGEKLDGATAVEWGLANYAVSGHSLALACDVAGRLALPPRDAMSVLKESLNAIDEHRIGTATQWSL